MGSSDQLDKLYEALRARKDFRDLVAHTYHAGRVVFINRANDASIKATLSTLLAHIKAPYDAAINDLVDFIIHYLMVLVSFDKIFAGLANMPSEYGVYAIDAQNKNNVTKVSQFNLHIYSAVYDPSQETFSIRFDPIMQATSDGLLKIDLCPEINYSNYGAQLDTSFLLWTLRADISPTKFFKFPIKHFTKSWLGQLIYCVAGGNTEYTVVATE